MDACMRARTQCTFPLSPSEFWSLELGMWPGEDMGEEKESQNQRNSGIVNDLYIIASNQSNLAMKKEGEREDYCILDYES